MQTLTLAIANKEGLHARPASMIMQCACEFEADVHLVVENERVNAKSIMSLISVNAMYGSQVLVEADGDDEQEALDALEALFASKFGED
jgi:phosphocarrier protein HPr